MATSLSLQEEFASVVARVEVNACACGQVRAARG